MSNTLGNGVNNIACATNSTGGNNNSGQNPPHLNGNILGSHRPSSTSSSSVSGPVTPLDLQPIFVSTPLEVVVQSEDQLSVGVVHSPNSTELLQRSPGSNSTSLACLMDSLSPLTSGNHGQQISGTKPSGIRERTLSQVLTDIVLTSTGTTSLDSEPGRRPQSTASGAGPNFDVSQGNFMSSTFDGLEANNPGVTGAVFLPIDAHPVTVPYEHTTLSSSETRAGSLGPDGERCTHLVSQVDTDTINTLK